MTKTPSGWSRRVAAAMGCCALAMLAAEPLAAQTTTSTNAAKPKVTNLGPTGTTNVIPAPAPSSAGSLPPGTVISKPPYQSEIALPYGAAAPAPYAYGATRPTTLAPTIPPTKGTALAKPVAPGPQQEKDKEQQGAAAGTAGAGTGTQPVDPRLGLPRNIGGGPGNGQPPIKAAPDFKPGDPNARSASAPSLPPPYGVSPYRMPYAIDSSGNYFSPPATYNQNGVLTPTATFRGKVDRRGNVYDQYGNRRGVIAK